MSLVFDRFPSSDHADRFVTAVLALEPELTAEVYPDAGAAAAAAIVLYELVAPVVLVERPDSSDDSAIEYARDQGFANDQETGAEREERLERLVVPFGGTYRGT